MAWQKGLQVLSAAAGFYAGYAWAVTRWAEGEPGSLLRAALELGGPLALAYGLALGVLFWPVIPVPALGGVRMVVAPAFATLSFAVGALGVPLALGAVGALL